jgi:DeoR/GlpR family transcriptional regulator of sugar metabolism
MKLDGRRQGILDLLMEAGTATVDDLSARFDVSKMTIHRDLDQLEQEGLLRKVRGGASMQSSGQFESDYRYRQRLAGPEKRRIAVAAAAFVEPGQTVIIDDSSTAGEVAKYLGEMRPLTVITNNLAVIQELSGAAGITLIALGGQYSKKFHGFFGLLADEGLRSLRADIAFVSTSSIHGTSAFHQDQEVVQTKRLMLAAAERKYLLVDHGKFGRPALHFLTALDAFDAVLTGEEPDAMAGKALKDAGIRLTIIDKD